MRLEVVRNTYPSRPGINRAEPGDIVEWRAYPRGWYLVRLSDGANVFGRDRLPKEQDDTRPMVGVIAQVKSKGWSLEIRQTEDGENG